MKILLVACPLGPLGTPLSGGVAPALRHCRQSLAMRGHAVEILAPTGSENSLEVNGRLQPPLQFHPSEYYPIMEDSVIANLWEEARQKQHDYDLIINFGHDWLPFYLTPFFKTPVVHRLNFSAYNQAVDDMVRKTDRMFPGRISALSRAQAATMELENFFLIRQGIDLTRYHFNATPKASLVWAGRISPEKGVEDAAQIAKRLDRKLRVFGYIQEERYWEKVLKDYAPWIDYGGFLSTDDLQKELGQCSCLLITTKVTEAFGQIVIEALACGTPVVTYDCGGPAEIVQDGKTGFIARTMDEMCARLQDIGTISRTTCREYAETHHSLEALAESYGDWFKEILKKRHAA